jgi:hypothetical protein
MPGDAAIAAEPPGTLSVQYPSASSSSAQSVAGSRDAPTAPVDVIVIEAADKARRQRPSLRREYVIFSCYTYRYASDTRFLKCKNTKLQLPPLSTETNESIIGRILKQYVT